MARLPVDVKLGAHAGRRATSAAACARCWSIAAFLGIQDPRERPADAARGRRQRARGVRRSEVRVRRHRSSCGMRIAQAHEDLTQSKLRDWCEKHFLGFLRMREWRELHRQLKLLCDELGLDSENAEDAPYADLHRALIDGPADADRPPQPTRASTTARAGASSSCSPARRWRRSRRPGCLSATLLDTERVWSLTNAAIEPDWVIAELPHLLARRQHRSALVALAGARGRQRTDQPVRPGAGAEAAGPLRRAVPGRSARRSSCARRW